MAPFAIHSHLLPVTTLDSESFGYAADGAGVGVRPPPTGPSQPTGTTARPTNLQQTKQCNVKRVEITFFGPLFQGVALRVPCAWSVRQNPHTSLHSRPPSGPPISLKPPWRRPVDMLVSRWA